MSLPVAVALRTTIVRQCVELLYCRAIVRIAHARSRGMFEAFRGVTGLESEVFIDNRAPARRVFINQNHHHPCEIVLEMPCQYLSQILAQALIRIAIPVMIDAFECSFAR